MKSTSQMPNQGSGKYGATKAKGCTNTGASTGLRKSNEQRADTTKAPSNKNPFPNGLA
jgi:hypothetical protein